jgi:hypothetical protein
MPLRTMFLWLLIASLGALALYAAAAVLMPNVFHFSVQVYASALIVGAFSIICLVCAIGLDRGRTPALMWIGITAAFAATGVWLLHVWLKLPLLVIGPLTKLGWTATMIALWALFGGQVFSMKPVQVIQRRLQVGAFGLLTGLAIFSAIAIWTEAEAWLWLQVFGTFFIMFGWIAWLAILMLLRLKSRWAHGIQLLTLAIGTCLAVLGVALVWIPGPTSEWSARILTALVIFTAAGTLILAILGVIERRRVVPMESLAGDLLVRLTCPRCGTAQQMRPGVHSCRKCRLRIGIEVHEPRCDCGYLLLDLIGDRCPECGRAVHL